MADTKKLTEKQKLKKVFKVIVFVFVALFVILGVLFGVMLLLKGEKVDYTEKGEGIYYFSADYNANSLEDEVYLSKNRDIMFTDRAGNGEPITGVDSEDEDVKSLMYNYFSALMEGDAQKHSRLLTDSYKSNFVVQESFTPQKVYDIDVRFLTGTTDGDKYLEKYQVSYKIYENDGTYRADVGSNIAKLMVFEIATENGRSMINSIVSMNVK